MNSKFCAKLQKSLEESVAKGDEVRFAFSNLTCDQASLYFRCGKVRLIQILDCLSVASPESGLFSDWSRNKRYLEQNKISVSLACY